MTNPTYSSFFSHPIEQIKDDSSSKFGFFTKENLGMKALIPFVIFSLTVSFAFAFSGDTETSVGNNFMAAADYPTGTPTNTPTPTPGEQAPCTTINGASVVINEINWMGSYGDGNDEWVELCNTTSSPIDLTDWVIENLGLGGPNANITITSGTIPANGFFLISANAQASSAINVPSDFVVAGIQLSDGGEQLVLKNDVGTVIDTANGAAGAWFAGDNSTKKSMERKSPIGSGTVAGSWQTAATHTGMDGSGADDEFGTPKNANGL
jgi:hypothetical protein